jgi:hypothetical protein
MHHRLLRPRYVVAYRRSGLAPHHRGWNAPLSMALVAALVITAGCNDQTPAGRLAAPTPASHSTSGVDRDWTHFAADISVETSGSRVFAHKPGAVHISKYHVERTRNADGRWSTSIDRSVGDARAMPRGASPNRLSRIEDDGTPAGRRYFGRNGAALEPLSSERLRSRFGMDPGQRPQVPRVVGGPKAAGIAGAFSSWRQAFSIDPAAVDSVRAKLRRQFDDAARVSDGEERYRRVRGDTLTELTLDPTVGDVRELRTSVGGRQALHVTYTYTALPNGLYARTGIRLERTGVGESTASVTTIAYSNLTLDHNGGR